MKYKNLHEYLDVVFQNADPSNEEIIQAKKQYWKLWFKNYHRERRSIRKEFTLGFDTETLEKIKGKKRQEQSTSNFLYESVKRALASDFKPAPNEELLSQVELKLMKLINLVEEHIEETDSELSKETLQRLEELENNLKF